MDVETRLIAIFRSVFFDLEDQPVSAIVGYSKTTAPAWDSAAHLLLLTCIEEEFSTKIPDDIAVDLDSFQVALALVLTEPS